MKNKRKHKNGFFHKVRSFCSANFVKVLLAVSDRMTWSVYSGFLRATYRWLRMRDERGNKAYYHYPQENSEYGMNNTKVMFSRKLSFLLMSPFYDNI